VFPIIYADGTELIEEVVKMASWKENKVVGIAAGVILILSIVVMAQRMITKPKPVVPETHFRALVPEGGVR